MTQGLRSGVAVEEQPTGPRRARRRPGPGAVLAGFVGELLLTAGILLGLFVVWQLWWTDIGAAREQDAAVTELVERFGEPEPAKVQRGEGEPPTEPAPAPGERFAMVHVPRWGADYRNPVAEGVGLADVLNTGYVGHYPDTALPGAIGNFALAGHRQTYGHAFLHVDQLVDGDAVVVETASAWYVYRVTDSYIVRPDQVEVIAPAPGEPGVEPTARSITLTTCHPLFSTRERWVVHGELDYWAPHDSGMPAELLQEA